jgi:nucleoside-diphosphate-sugar epimerase
MRVFVAGATGVIGRRLVPLLVEHWHEVTGMTRRVERREAIEAMGARAAVCDVFEAERLAEAVAAARPELVIHELTDLPRDLNPRRMKTQLASNDRIRTEGRKPGRGRNGGGRIRTCEG